jgi:protein-tyrosine phosphatase
MGAMIAPYRVTVVCTGNICRSPMGEIVLRQSSTEADLGDQVEVDRPRVRPAGTSATALTDAAAAAARRGYDGSEHRARQFTPGLVRPARPRPRRRQRPPAR